MESNGAKNWMKKLFFALAAVVVLAVVLLVGPAEVATTAKGVLSDFGLGYKKALAPTPTPTPKPTEPPTPTATPTPTPKPTETATPTPLDMEGTPNVLHLTATPSDQVLATPTATATEGANPEAISGSENDPLVPIIQEVQEKYPDVEFIVGHDQGAVSDAIIDQLKSSGEWEKLTAPQKKAVEALVESKELNHELNSLDPEALSQVTNDVLTILRYDSKHNRFMAPSGKSLTLEALNQKISKLAKKDPALAEILQEILQAVQSDTSVDWKNIRINTARFLQEKDPEKIRAFFVLLDIYRQWFKINGDPNPILHSLQITPFEVVPHGSVVAGGDLDFLTGKFAEIAINGLANLPDSNPFARFKSYCDPSLPGPKGTCQFCYGYPPGMMLYSPKGGRYDRIERVIAIVSGISSTDEDSALMSLVVENNGKIAPVMVAAPKGKEPEIARAWIEMAEELNPKDEIAYLVPHTGPDHNVGVNKGDNVRWPSLPMSLATKIFKGCSNNSASGGSKGGILPRPKKHKRGKLPFPL